MTLRVSYNYYNEFDGSNYLFSRLLNHPTFGPQLSERWRLALDGPLHPDNINAVIDDYMDDIGPSAARDWSKWESSYKSYGGWSYYRNDWATHEEEVQYVREWMEERHDYFDSIYP